MLYKLRARWFWLYMHGAIVAVGLALALLQRYGKL
jgi:hypothetical protein